MTTRPRRHPLPFSIQHSAISILFLALAGCASDPRAAVKSGHNTALDGVDLVKMTDDMAQQISADPEVRAAFTQYGPLRVVVMPVENYMRGEVLSTGAKQAFTSRVRLMLARQAPGQFVWVMNRDEFRSLRARELDTVDLGPDPDVVNPQYALTAKFTSLADEDRKRRSSFYVCRYELTSLADRSVLWAGSYEVKKVAVKQFLD